MTAIYNKSLSFFLFLFPFFCFPFHFCFFFLFFFFFAIFFFSFSPICSFLFPLFSLPILSGPLFLYLPVHRQIVESTFSIMFFILYFSIILFSSLFSSLLAHFFSLFLPFPFYLLSLFLFSSYSSPLTFSSTLSVIIT